MIYPPDPLLPNSDTQKFKRMMLLAAEEDRLRQENAERRDVQQQQTSEAGA